MRFKVTFQDDNQINCSVWDERTKVDWILTCMYGSPYKDSRKDLSWSVVKQMGTTMTSPRLIIGDLNVILRPEEKRGGNKANTSEMGKFSAIFNNIGIQDL